MGRMFSVEALAPALGSLVTGLDLAQDADAGVVADLIALLYERGVVVLRNQSLSDAAYVEFGRRWGRPLTFFLPEHRKDDFPEMIRIGNDPATPSALRDGAVHWHSDSSYEEVPAAVTMLYGKEAPRIGGFTHFASTTVAYDALDDGMKARLDSLVALHELGAAPWIEGETPPDPNRPKRDLPRQRHPLIMRHPVTGKRAIFTSGTAFAIDGMDGESAFALIRQLRRHVVKPEFRLSWKIMPGDVVLWDNFTTMHCASPIPYSNADGERRLLFRISTKGLPVSLSPRCKGEG